jgi:hypothetical protein
MRSLINGRRKINRRSPWSSAAIKGEAGSEGSFVFGCQFPARLRLDEPDKGRGVFDIGPVAPLVIGMLK